MIRNQEDRLDMLFGKIGQLGKYAAKRVIGFIDNRTIVGPR